MLEDYDEFGNYIGADLESDEEEEEPQFDFARPTQPQPQASAPLEGFDEDVQEENALMEIDGTSSLRCHSIRQKADNVGHRTCA